MRRRWLGRVFVGVLLLVAALGGSLVLSALLLPADGSDRVLEVRGRYGGVGELAAWVDRDSVVRHLELRNDHGESPTSAWVRQPLRLEPDYRILITYAGARTGERILGLIPPSDDLVLVAVQYPFDTPRTTRARARAPYDIRQAAYRTVAGGLLAVDYLEQEASLDPERILLIGASLGSFFATLHGALDPRIPEVLLVHGGADLPPVLERAIASRTPGWLLPAVVRLARIPVDTFDPGRYVDRIAPRRLVVIAARDDRHFPPEAVQAFFERAGEPKELLWTDTGHVGAAKQEIVDLILAEITAYLEQAPPLPVTPAASG